MASGNINNHQDHHEEISNISTSINEPTDILVHDSPRRSSRLSSKSSQVVTKSANQTNLHRTVLGGINSVRSPKLNTRRKSSSGRGRDDYSNALSQTIADGVNNIRITTDDRIMLRSTLPSDQSEDDEMICDPNIHQNNNVTTVTSKIASRTQVLSYFEEKATGFYCNDCNKIYRASKSSDTNLRKHLSLIHKVPNILFKSQISNYVKPEPVNTVTPDRKRELIDAAVDCILEDGLPFNVFRKPGMSRFLCVAVPGFTGPHRKTVRRRIGILYTNYQSKLRARLPRLGLLSLTSDLWKNCRSIHFISLTAHIYTRDYQNIPIVLSCRRIIGKLTGDLIERYIKHELDCLGIPIDQIISITTDNGSNIKKATSSFQFGQRISCMAHNLNLVVKKGICLWNEPDKKHFPIKFDTSGEQWEDIDEDIDDLDDDDGSYSNEETIDAANDLVADGENDPNESEDDQTAHDDIIDAESDDDCTEIKFSTILLNDQDLSSSDHFQLLTYIFPLMTKTRSIIKFLRNHNVINGYIVKAMVSQNNGKKTGVLVLDMIIRWSSSYLLLDRLFLHKDILNGLFAFPNSIPHISDEQRTQLQKFTLTQSEWSLLQCLKHVLAPFAETTIVLSGQHYATMDISFHVYRLLCDFLESTDKDHPVIVRLKESLRYWFIIQCKNKLPNGQMDLMMIAAFLNPMFYKKISEDDRKSSKKLIFKKLNNTHPGRATSSSSTSTAVTTTTTEHLNPLEKLAVLCGHPSSVSKAHRQMSIDEEISSYIKATQNATDFREFWISNEKRLPRLSNLVRRTNVIPVTSISSEALFSVASYLQRKQRASLSSKSLRYLLILKNRHILNKLEQNY